MINNYKIVVLNKLKKVCGQQFFQEEFLYISFMILIPSTTGHHRNPRLSFFWINMWPIHSQLIIHQMVPNFDKELQILCYMLYFTLS